MEHRFTARLRGISAPGTPSFIEVPRRVMRALSWGRNVKVLAMLNGYSYRTTIMNVGFGSSFLVQHHTRFSAGVRVNDHIDVCLLPLQSSKLGPVPPRKKA